MDVFRRMISAGTGLGEALIYADRGKLKPIPSEGGHAGFAPGNQLEVELYQYLYSELGQVEVEDVVSLRGLQNVFNFLVDTQGGKRSAWVDKADNIPRELNPGVQLPFYLIDVGGFFKRYVA